MCLQKPKTTGYFAAVLVCRSIQDPDTPSGVEQIWVYFVDSPATATDPSDTSKV